MKRLYLAFLALMTTLSVACNPIDNSTNSDDNSGGNNTETPTPEPTPDPQPEIVEVTLTSEECADYIAGYGKPNSYTNSFGTWEICAYKYNGAMQINKGKVAYIGTPTFKSDICKVKITFIEGYSGEILLCSAAGTTSTEGQFESFKCSGTSTEYTLTTAGHKLLYIRSSACARITSVTIVSGGGGSTPAPDPDPTPNPTPDPTPDVGEASESWLELPAVDNGKLYPNAVQVTIYSGSERNYTILYDKKTYASMWVAYPLESKHMGSYSRPKSWSYNPYIDQAYQVNLCSSSYSGDTYSRGHLIPNASRNGIKDMQLQTFYVTNSVPQVQTRFNDGVWNSLEQAMQKIAESEKIYIVTGIAFSKVGESKSISYITANNDSKQIPIPNYFFKVALKVTTNGSGVVTSASTIGFWFENKQYTDSFTNYAVSVDQIEQWTGFNFFPNLPDSVETSAESNKSWSGFQGF